MSYSVSIVTVPVGFMETPCFSMLSGIRVVFWAYVYLGVVNVLLDDKLEYPFLIIFFM